MTRVTGLLGADVVRRTEGGSGLCDRRIVLTHGEAEVHEARATALVDQDVGGLDVAVNDPHFVGVLQSFAQRTEEAQALPFR